SAAPTARTRPISSTPGRSAIPPVRIRRPDRSARRRARLSGCGSALRCRAAAEELPPVVDAHLDVELLRRGLDTLPGLVAFGVGDVLDLVETSDRVANVRRVVDRFLAPFRERELLALHPVLFGGADALGTARNALAVRAGTLRRPSLLQVLSSRVLLLRRSHTKGLSTQAADTAGDRQFGRISRGAQVISRGCRRRSSQS